MVKSPKIRHSKQRDEPVTIDLSAEDVKRGDAKPGKDEQASPAPKPSSSEKGKASSGSASAAKSAASGSGDAKSGASDKPAATGSDKEKSGSAGSASSFGRGSGSKSEPKSQGAQKDSGPAPKPTEPRRGGGVGALAAGLVGGVIALAGAGALYFGGFLPATSAPPATDNTVVERLETELASMREEIATLQSAPQSGDTGELSAALAETDARLENMAVLVEDLRGDLGRLSDAVAAGGGGDNAALAELQTRLAKIEQAVANMPDSGGRDTDAISAELAKVADQVISLSAALSDLTASTRQKFSAIDETLASLGARIDEQANEPGVALAIAASALKAAIDRGQPFANELETFARLAPEAPEIDALRSYAATGVPTAAAIAGETDAVAQRIIAAAKPDDSDAGLFDRLWASAESLITVRPIGAVEGEDVPAIVARMEAAINNGDYAGAVAEYETLPDDAKAAGAEFITGVKARQAADELVSKVLADALRA